MTRADERVSIRTPRYGARVRSAARGSTRAQIEATAEARHEVRRRAPTDATHDEV